MAIESIPKAKNLAKQIIDDCREHLVDVLSNLKTDQIREGATRLDYSNEYKQIIKIYLAPLLTKEPERGDVLFYWSQMGNLDYGYFQTNSEEEYYKEIIEKGLRDNFILDMKLARITAFESWFDLIASLMMQDLFEASHDLLTFIQTYNHKLKRAKTNSYNYPPYLNNYIINQIKEEYTIASYRDNMDLDVKDVYKSAWQKAMKFEVKSQLTNQKEELNIPTKTTKNGGWLKLNQLNQRRMQTTPLLHLISLNNDWCTIHEHYIQKYQKDYPNSLILIPRKEIHRLKSFSFDFDNPVAAEVFITLDIDVRDQVYSTRIEQITGTDIRQGVETTYHDDVKEILIDYPSKAKAFEFENRLIEAYKSQTLTDRIKKFLDDEETLGILRSRKNYHLYQLYKKFEYKIELVTEIMHKDN